MARLSYTPCSSTWLRWLIELTLLPDATLFRALQHLDRGAPALALTQGSNFKLLGDAATSQTLVNRIARIEDVLRQAGRKSTELRLLNSIDRRHLLTCFVRRDEFSVKGRKSVMRWIDSADFDQEIEGVPQTLKWRISLYPLRPYAQTGPQIREIRCYLLAVAFETQSQAVVTELIQVMEQGLDQITLKDVGHGKQLQHFANRLATIETVMHVPSSYHILQRGQADEQKLTCQYLSEWAKKRKQHVTLEDVLQKGDEIFLDELIPTPHLQGSPTDAARLVKWLHTTQNRYNRHNVKGEPSRPAPTERLKRLAKLFTAQDIPKAVIDEALHAGSPASLPRFGILADAKPSTSHRTTSSELLTAQPRQPLVFRTDGKPVEPGFKIKPLSGEALQKLRRKQAKRSGKG